MTTKKIAQFRYFGEKYIPAYVTPNTFDKQKDKLYIQDDDLIYNKIPADATFSSSSKYYLLNENNYPSSLNKTRLRSGSAFNNFTPIIKLGIQSLPGTRFRVNANTDWIIVGTTGLYELDLSQTSAVITSLNFEETAIDNVHNNPNAYLIIDMVYEEVT